MLFVVDPPLGALSARPVRMLPVVLAPGLPHPETVAVISIPDPRATIARACWIVFETCVVPAALLCTFVMAGHPMLGVLAALVWRVGCVGLRMVGSMRVPTTVWVALGVFGARTVISLAFTSVTLYLWQPTVMSAAIGLVFLVGALRKRPLAMDLARDFVTMGPEVLDSPAARGLFRVLTAIWGAIHLVGALAGALALRLPMEQMVAVHSAIGLGCLVGAVGVCSVVGLVGVRRCDRLAIRFGSRGVASALPLERSSLAVPVAELNSAA